MKIDTIYAIINKKKGLGESMDNYESDFNTEFMSDGEIEEMLDNLITTIGDEAAADNSKTAIINPIRVKQILYTYKVMKYLTKGTKATVKYALHQPFRSVGYVSVTGTNLVFKNAEWFVKAVELASNFEVFPKTNGTVEMNFTFHGITRTVE